MTNSNKLVLFLILFANLAFSQETVEEEKWKWFEYRGYVKFMQTIGINNLNTIPTDNLIHNRFNLKLSTPKIGNLDLQIRNRIHYGYSVNNLPTFGKNSIDYDGLLPLEALWLDNDQSGILANQSQLVFSSIIDRLYYTYNSEKWQIKIGRQRINWGMNTTWNPNDIFNSYNIYDFDYEERQGADGVRIKYYPNYSSSIEFAYKATGDFKSDVTALKYQFNVKSYDLQFLAGKFKEKAVFGMGWAGSLKQVGFKGEASFFQPYNSSTDSLNLSVSTSLDYAFSNGLYIMGAYLYNSSGTNQKLDNPVSTTVPNAEYLMVTQHNAILLGNYAISPIINIGLNINYGFGMNLLAIVPNLTISATETIDFDLISQLFSYQTSTSKFGLRASGIFWRVRYSF